MNREKIFYPVQNLVCWRLECGTWVFDNWSTAQAMTLKYTCHFNRGGLEEKDEGGGEKAHDVESQS